MNPNQSEKVAELAKALAKAQSEMSGAIKASVNPHFKSRYADLAAVFDACRAALNKNEIAIVQRVENDPNGVAVSTTLLHSSGEWISDRCWLPVAQKTAQAYGSAITYGRRYGLAALAGVAAEEDDDGNAASAPMPAQARPQPAPVAQAEPHPVDSQEAIGGPVVPFGKNKGKPLSELSAKSLEWYLSTALADIADPAKERFKAKTEAWAEALRQEIASR
jgi:hypothetical protein